LPLLLIKNVAASRQIAFTENMITRKRGSRNNHPGRMQIMIGLTFAVIPGLDGSKSRHSNNLFDIILAMQYMD
jgi:hypothetical protein